MNTSSATDENVKLVLFQLGHRNQVTAIAVTFLLPTIIAAGYYTELPKPELWMWLGLMLVAGAHAIVHRIWALRTMKRGGIDLEFVTRWRRHYFVQACLIGFGWGNLGLLFVSGNFTQNAALMVIFLGIGAGASNTAGMHHLVGMAVATVLSIFMQLTYLPRGFGEHALPMQMIMLLYLLVLLFIGRNVNRLVLESILLRFEKEDLLREKTLEAARADRANLDKSMFLAAASHDLRQPVHALLLLVTALHQRVCDAAQRELVEHIQKAGQAIANLFNALMELSRLESGAEKPQPRQVQAAELLRQAVARQQPQAREKGLSLAVRVSESAEQACLHIDDVMLGRIVDNLLSNAIRYTPRGRVLATLRLRRPDTLWLEVRDSGIGIPEESLAHIFDPYYQVGNAERDRSKGLGLGLAIVRKTADLIGCAISVRSRLGHGTCFRIALAHAQLAPSPATARTPAEFQAPDLGGNRILVVDDDPMVLDAMRILLASWHADVRVVRSAEQCLALIEGGSWQPACVLCDYRLPGNVNGMELLGTLSRRNPDMVAILQTGELDPAIAAAADEAGYILLTKPVAAPALASTLAAVITSDAG